MEKQKITGSEALLKSLIAEGVDTIFGYPGGQAIPIYDSLYDYRDKLKHVLVRHEQGATHAAQEMCIRDISLCYAGDDAADRISFGFHFGDQSLHFFGGRRVRTTYGRIFRLVQVVIRV